MGGHLLEADHTPGKRRARKRSLAVPRNICAPRWHFSVDILISKVHQGVHAGTLFPVRRPADDASTYVDRRQLQSLATEAVERSRAGEGHHVPHVGTTFWSLYIERMKPWMNHYMYSSIESRIFRASILARAQRREIIEGPDGRTGNSAPGPIYQASFTMPRACATSLQLHLRGPAAAQRRGGPKPVNRGGARGSGASETILKISSASTCASMVALWCRSGWYRISAFF